VQNAFTAVVDVSGLLFAAFYILTAVATIVYYRRRVLAGFGDAIVLGVLPVAAVAFLAWIIVRSLQAAPASQIWSLVGVVLLGLAMLVIARVVLRSPFFGVPQESDTPGR
jgi:L-asparagine transporter-like permease